jgi:hypothetical protein
MQSRTKLYIFLLCLTLYAAVLMTVILPATTDNNTTTASSRSNNDGMLLRPKEGNHKNNYNVQQPADDKRGSHQTSWFSMRHMQESKSTTTTSSTTRSNYLHNDKTTTFHNNNNNNNLVIRNLSTESLSLFQPPFGFVLRDLARRILSRHITNSNILVVAPDAISAAKDGIQRQRQRRQQQEQEQDSKILSSNTPQNTKNTMSPVDTVDFTSPYSIGGTFLLHAAAEGHVLHAINYGERADQHDDDNNDKNNNYYFWNNHTWDDWWQSFEEIMKAEPSSNQQERQQRRRQQQQQQQQRWWSSSSTLSASVTQQQRPNWILAAVVDLPLGQEDAIWAGARQFLQESTTTYFVVALHSRQRQRQQHQHNSGDSDTVEYGGLAACQALLSRRYKLQVLLVSHYHVEHPGEEGWTEEHFGPNALLSSTDKVKEFLTWGAAAASQYQDTGHRPEHGDGGDKDAGGPIFTAYIFATQGLDLAIPSNRVFLQDTSRVMGEESTTQINRYKPLQFKPCPQASLTPALKLEFSEVRPRVQIVHLARLYWGPHVLSHLSKTLDAAYRIVILWFFFILLPFRIPLLCVAVAGRNKYCGPCSSFEYQ